MASVPVSDTVIAARRGIVVPPAPAIQPAPIRAPAGAIDTTAPASSIWTAIRRVATAPTFGGDRAATPANYPNVTNTGGAPPAGTGMASQLAGMSPHSRSIMKVLPFVAAAYFFTQGDTGLAAISAAGGVAAAVWL